MDRKLKGVAVPGRTTDRGARSSKSAPDLRSFRRRLGRRSAKGGRREMIVAMAMMEVMGKVGREVRRRRRRRRRKEGKGKGMIPFAGDGGPRRGYTSEIKIENPKSRSPISKLGVMPMDIRPPL
ncbi:hypothetical protein CRG98_020494 [Punica granatum]|uniref:Uncharacterized protein n=1 Tax=Punica granatum TaxID=22663 RepID=A0A2I0JS42_PUNGR|nr:hypothetical protein CRG98_020494 [Punica granatum]